MATAALPRSVLGSKVMVVSGGHRTICLRGTQLGCVFVWLPSVTHNVDMKGSQRGRRTDCKECDAGCM